MSVNAINATTDTLRTADLPTLAAALNDQRTRSVDVVVPASKLRVTLGAVDIQGCDPVMSDDGVTDVNGFYVPTRVGDEGIAAKLDIPLRYLRKCRAENIGLYDDNVNGWLATDSSKFLLRLLMHRDGNQVDGQAGVLRGFMSDTYRTIDHFDVLLAALKGITGAGLTDPWIEADLTERRMIVRVSTPDIRVYAEELLKGYRSPFGGGDARILGRDGSERALGGWTPERVARAAAAEGGSVAPDDQVVFAGFVISNSENGGGAFSITPRIVIGPCTNGLQISADALKRVHLGAKLDAGIVRVSDETIHRNLALVSSQATDAVRTFLDVDYVKQAVTNLEADAGIPVEDAAAVVSTVSDRLGFSEADAALILGHFIKGGQLTCGGVMQAVTSAAQTITDGDVAWDMECNGVKALEYAVAAVRS